MEEPLKPAEVAELERYRQAEVESIRSQAVNAALAGYNLNPGADRQIAALIKDEVQIVADATGRKVAIGPGFRPVAEVIRERLATPEYAHFHLGSSSGQVGPPPRGENEQLGNYLMRSLQAEQAQLRGPETNPALNLRLPMGIAPKS